MIIYKSASDLSSHLSELSRKNNSLGFVPTMGALHQGHLSLVEHSKKKCNITIASIFVNPTQFNDPSDFAKYPVTLDNDLFLLEKSGCDIVFLPPVNEIYPGGTELAHTYNIGRLETLLEGQYRPGHFQGVCQVVDRLLEIVNPSVLFLGQKDYQQCMVIRELIRLTGRKIETVIVPTVREVSGLAMSSRNMRLSEQDKTKAKAIYEGLTYIKTAISKGPVSVLVEEVSRRLTAAGFEEIDYISIADAATLEPIDVWDGKTPLVALAAAFIGGIRLIDNLQLS